MIELNASPSYMPQITDRKGVVADVLWAQLPVLGLCHQFLTLAGNLIKTECIRMMDDWNDQVLARRRQFVNVTEAP